MQFKLRPIGHVETDANHEALRHRLAVSRIIIDGKFAAGLKRLQGFSHFYVLFLLHEAPKWGGWLTVHPKGRLDLGKVGVFATRSPHRPNPIGLTLVKLLSRKGRILKVKGLDAYDGTPVIDLKPYDSHDSAPRARVPLWLKKLERESKHAECLNHRRSSRSAHRVGRFGSRTR